MNHSENFGTGRTSEDQEDARRSRTLSRSQANLSEQDPGVDFSTLQNESVNPQIGSEGGDQRDLDDEEVKDILDQGIEHHQYISDL